jgi:molybdopterin converting factor small subunit
MRDELIARGRRLWRGIGARQGGPCLSLDQTMVADDIGAAGRWGREVAFFPPVTGAER